MTRTSDEVIRFSADGSIPVRFRLSNRQAKELAVRGARMRLAIPAPPYEVKDPRAYFAGQVDGLDPSWVKSAEALELLTAPNHGAAGSAGIYGTILDDARYDAMHGEGKTLTVVVAIVATVEPPAVRRDATAVAWCGQVRVRGEWQG